MTRQQNSKKQHDPFQDLETLRATLGAEAKDYSELQLRMLREELRIWADFLIELWEAGEPMAKSPLSSSSHSLTDADSDAIITPRPPA